MQIFPLFPYNFYFSFISYICEGYENSFQMTTVVNFEKLQRDL